MKKLVTISLIFFISIGMTSAASLQCQPINEQGERLIDQKSQDQIEQCIKNEPHTKTLHYNEKTKQYNPAREKLHNQIIEEILKSKPCVSKNPIAIFTAGLPAAGKTTFLKDHLKNLDSYLIVDADSIREKLPEYKGWNALNTQSEVNDIVFAILDKIGKPCNINLIYDSSMSAPDRYIKLEEHLQSLGYSTYIIYGRLPLKIAQERALKRYQESGRYVNKEFLQYVSGVMEESFEKVKPVVNGYVIFNGENGKIVEEKGDVIKILK